MSNSPIIAALHDDGEQIVVVSATSKNGPNGQVWTNKAFTKISDALVWIDGQARLHKNVYVKHANHDGIEQRLQSGVVMPDCHAPHFTGSRSFFLDVDVGKKKFYVSNDAALNALKLTLIELGQKGIPTPTLVQLTGGGVQAVWTVTDPFPPAEWDRLNAILYDQILKTKLKCDTGARPIDRSVRVCGPGYVNVNHGSVLPTNVIAVKPRISSGMFKSSLGAHSTLQLVATDKAVSVRTGLAQVVDDDSEFDIRPDPFVLDLSLIVDDCKILHEAIMTEGEHHSRDHWINLVGLIAKNGDEDYGRGVAHLISAKHSTHNPVETDKKLAEFKKSKKPTLCKTFQSSLPGVCETCAFYGVLNSPAGIQNRKKLLAPSPVVPDGSTSDFILGGPYYNAPQGVCRRAQKSDDENKLIWHGTKIENINLHHVDGNHNHRIITMTHNTSASNGPGRELMIDMSLADRPQSTATMLAKGFSITLKSAEAKQVHDAMTDWMTKLLSRGVQSTHYTRMGWSVDSSVFVLGGTAYHTSGKKEAVHQSLRAMSHVATGDKTEYMKIVGGLIKAEQRAEAHAFMAGALGSVFLKPMGAPGIAINLHSSTGFGKTTLAKVASSFWGLPRALGMGVDDTDNAAQKILSELNSLPGFYDEIKRSEKDLAEWLNRLVFRLTGSVEKARLDGNSRQMDRGLWQTPMMFCTNYCFSEVLRRHTTGADAALARVLDLLLEPLPTNSIAMVSRVNADVAKLDFINGHVGHAFIEHIVTNLPRYQQYLDHYVTKLLKVTSRTSTDVSGRNHASAGAAMIVSAAIVERLGLLPLQPKLVEQAVTRALLAGRATRFEARIDVDPEVLMSNYLKLREDSRLTTIVSSVDKSKRKNFFDMSRPLTRAVAYEVDMTNRQIMVDVVMFVNWLRENNYPTTSTIAMLEKKFQKVRQALGAGIEGYGGSKRDLLIIPGKDDFESFFV